MKRDPNGLRDLPAEALSTDLGDPRTANDALLRWDELDEQLLGLLAEDPERGRRLRKLQDADGWLRSRAAEAARKSPGPALLLCPPAEELYDFGQGPGATDMIAARRDAIDRHLATCRECERFVATLATPPPSPLILGLVEEAAPARDIAPAPLRRVESLPPVRRRRRLWPALAAAAAVVVIAVGVRQFSARPLQFPQAPLLRGSAGGPVLFPRERVLLASTEARALFPALGAPLVFEVEPQASTDEYRFEVFRHEGGAFGQDTQLDVVHSSAPTATWKHPREPGHFTLEAWATVHGLDQRLGAHDFNVVADPKLDAQLLALSGRTEPDRTLAAVVLLHESGFATDARALARTLPASAERDRYLGQSPGR